MARNRNVLDEYSLSDNEKEFVWLIKYIDYKHRKKEMVIYAKDRAQMVHIFRKCEGTKASIVTEEKVSIKKYKEMKL